MTLGESEKSRFTRPGFIVGALMVSLIVVLGVLFGMWQASGNEPEPNSAPPSPASSSSVTSSAAPTDESSAKAKGGSGGDSVCGLDGEVLSGKIAEAPAAEWEYQGMMSYPTSEKHGPAKTNDAGVRYCFQHSPEGALFTAANAVVQGSHDPEGAFINYFLSLNAPNRSDILGATGNSDGSHTRMNIVGFRLLSYEGATAAVDIAARVTSSGKTVYFSGIYNLTWEDGDWKLLPVDGSDPLPFAPIPDLVGYTSWTG
ncbi:hypothetical protein [Arthrobacter sp. zg-Y238]|uniref:hypothetical protein n=1 Tax=Arthrobacter sp. zg-Y238 TaxID=2964614 RepID=UPI0021077AEB|nr:hypothetical protein [Arthrobacter sp. zg-Y238]MCQ1952434.1 hypothetical protein [Arthrobacter sp. zg-Y238]